MKIVDKRQIFVDAYGRALGFLKKDVKEN